MKKKVYYYIGGAVTTCKRFKDFKLAIEHTGICYAMSKMVFPDRIVFRVDPMPTFLDGFNRRRFNYLKDRLV